MGAHCCKWLSRPCRKYPTISNKVNNLYQVPSGHTIEHHTKLQAQRLGNYLRDRGYKTESIIRDVKKRCLQAMSNEMTLSDKKVVWISLYALKVLVGQNKDFLPLTYQISYMLMMKPEFEEFKELVYETLYECTRLYPEEYISQLEDIMSDILNYASDPRNVGKHEVCLLANLGYVLKEEIVSGTNIRWQNAVDLALHRVLCMEEGEHIEELNLITNYSSFMTTNANLVHLFIENIIDYIDSNKLWSEKTLKVFSAILNARPKNSSILYSEISKKMIYYLENFLKRDPVSVHPIECLVVVIRNSSESIPTLFYNDTLKEVMLSLARLNLTPQYEDLIEVWSHRTDCQSFIKFAKSIILDENISSEHTKIYKRIKKAFNRELREGRLQLAFLQGTIEIIYEVSVAMQSRDSVFLLKALCFLLYKTRRKFFPKKNEQIQINYVLLKYLYTNSKHFTKENLLIYNRCLKIWLYLLSQRKQVTVARTVSVVLKIKKLISEINNTYHKYCLSILNFALLKGLGAVYSFVALEELVNRLAEQHLSNGMHKSMLIKTKFKNVLNFKIEMFKEEEFEVVLEEAFPIPHEVFEFEKNTEVEYVEDSENCENFELETPIKEFDPFAYETTESEISSIVSIEADKAVDPSEVKGEFMSSKNYSQKLTVQEEEESKFLSDIVD
mmetsp:Transcript_2358/g.3742  ORF Transcript_2358/g.3742 Transcript_2358/m.3742 type:complete len:671 (-) Transcript_2358:60-2072(-)